MPGDELACAARKGDVAEINRLLDAGDHVDTPRSSGFTALLAAAWYGRVVVTERLLTAGASLDRQLPNGTIALHLGCRNGPKDVVERLLERGADPTAPTLHRWFDRSTALGKAELA